MLRLVTQSCPNLCNRMAHSPPGSSVHGKSPGKNTGVGSHFLLQGIFPTQGSNLFDHPLNHQESPHTYEHIYVLMLFFSYSVMSHSLWPHGLQHGRLPCSWPSPRACSNSCPSGWWCHPTISSYVIPFSSSFLSFSLSMSFSVIHLFPSGGQRIGASASASVLPMNIQGWFPLGWTGLIL